MSCTEVRDVLSAALDNEAAPVELASAQLHAASCGDCTGWLAEVTTLHRRIRVAEAEAIPDLSGVIARAIHAQVRTRRPPVAPAARIILGVLALSELLGAIPHLLAPAAALGVHAGREQAAYEIALASGFFYAAIRPRLAAGVAVLSAVFASLLVITTGADVVEGQVRLGLEMHHLVAILGTLLTWAVARGMAPTTRMTRPGWAGA